MSASKASKTILLLFLSAIVATIILFLFLKTTDSYISQGDREELKRGVLALTEDDHVYGSRNADVFLIIYSDVKCQYCRTLYPRLKTIVNSYPEGTVALVYRHTPLFSLRGEVYKSEIVSECVARKQGDRPFFSYLDILFGDLSNDETFDSLADEVVYGPARIVGLNAEEISACFTDVAITEKIERDHTTGGVLGVLTIPHTFIVSQDELYEIVGNKPVSTFTQIIDSMLSE